MFKRVSEFIKEHALLATALATVVSGGLSFVGGLASADWIDFRKTQREMVKSEASQVADAEKAVFEILRKFSAKANGSGATTESDLADLRKEIGRIYLSAERLSHKMPELRPDFEQYAETLVQMQKAAEKLNSPLDGKPFVESVSKYFNTQAAFNSRVNARQNDWI